MGGIAVYKQGCLGTPSIGALVQGLVCLKDHTDGKTMTAPLVKHPLTKFRKAGWGVR